MRIRAILLVAALYAAPACGQQAVITSACRNNDFVRPDKLIRSVKVTTLCFAVWSPDGKWVLFDRFRPQGGDIWMIKNFE
jgi:hypothetical protein